MVDSAVIHRRVDKKMAVLDDRKTQLQDNFGPEESKRMLKDYKLYSGEQFSIVGLNWDELNQLAAASKETKQNADYTLTDEEKAILKKLEQEKAILKKLKTRKDADDEIVVLDYDSDDNKFETQKHTTEKEIKIDVEKTKFETQARKAEEIDII